MNFVLVQPMFAFYGLPYDKECNVKFLFQKIKMKMKERTNQRSRERERARTENQAKNKRNFFSKIIRCLEVFQCNRKISTVRFIGTKYQQTMILGCFCPGWMVGWLDGMPMPEIVSQKSFSFGTNCNLYDASLAIEVKSKIQC